MKSTQSRAARMKSTARKQRSMTASGGVTTSPHHADDTVVTGVTDTRTVTTTRTLAGSSVTQVGKFAETAINTVDGVMTKATSEVDTYIKPLRQSVLARFPIVFSLLTTLGVVTTFLGLEKMVARIPFLDQNPLVMLILGVSILALTGTLYKKLS